MPNVHLYGHTDYGFAKTQTMTVANETKTSSELQLASRLQVKIGEKDQAAARSVVLIRRDESYFLLLSVTVEDKCLEDK